MEGAPNDSMRESLTVRRIQLWMSGVTSIRSMTGAMSCTRVLLFSLSALCGCPGAQGARDKGSAERHRHEEVAEHHGREVEARAVAVEELKAQLAAVKVGLRMVGHL